MNYRWQLRKGGRKLRCPNCGKLRFVPFVSVADGTTLAGEEYGRCDREQSCGYFRYPRGVARTKDCENGIAVMKPPALFPLTAIQSSIPIEFNSLFRAFVGKFDELALRAAFDRYLIATSSDGGCIFPQFDGKWIRTAKTIHYDEAGHRRKDGLPVSWLHAQRSWRDYMKSRQLKQCFFGEHLLADDSRPVIVVESEKSALLLSAMDSSRRFLWIACGGSQMLKGAISFESLKNREVILIPDDGQYWNWKRTSEHYGWRIVDINEFNDSSLPSGYDYLDLKLRKK